MPLDFQTYDKVKEFLDLKIEEFEREEGRQNRFYNKKLLQSIRDKVLLPHFVPGWQGAPRGALLYGPPGTGKTFLVRVRWLSSTGLRVSSFGLMTTGKVCDGFLPSHWAGECRQILQERSRRDGEAHQRRSGSKQHARSPSKRDVHRRV